MRKILLFSFVLSGLFQSCKQKPVEYDDIFQYKDYIYSTTYGVVSVTESINVHLTKKVEKWALNEEIEEDLFDISPYLPGKTVMKTPYIISFVPDEQMKPSTEYTVSLHLDELFDGVPENYKTYTFQFKTKSRDFIIQTGSIQSYSKDWQYLEGELITSDYLPLEKVRDFLNATQKHRELPVKWEELQSGVFRFTIDSIRRYDDTSYLNIRWDGSSAGISEKGEEEYLIPGKSDFNVVDMRVVQQPDQYLIINFSDPLLQSQDFKGLVSIEEAKRLKFLAEGNELRVYPEARLNGNLTVEVFSGIKNSDGVKLSKNFTAPVSFEMLKPQISLIDSGVFLPDSGDLTLHFKAVNIQRVTVRIIKIFEDNILQFMQDNELSGDYNLRKVGRLIAKKTITLIENPRLNKGRWEAYGIDLSKIIKTEPGAIYRVELDFGMNDVLYGCRETESGATNYDGEYPGEEEPDFTYEELDEEEMRQREEAYWDNKLYRYKRYYWDWEQRNNPCHPAYYNERGVAINLIASNIGLVAKHGNSGKYNFAATNILTAKPMSGVKISLYNYQQQEIATLTTDAKGMASYTTDKHANFAIARKGADKTYLNLEDGYALPVSNFNVGGKSLKKGMKGYLYGERGVWRPGDTLHLTFVLNDKYNPIPEGHPIRFELRDERNGLVHKQVDSYHKDNFLTYHIPTDPDAPTGTWKATVKVGGVSFSKNIPIATVKPNRLKINLDLGDEKILSMKEGLQGTLSARWLHGAPAGDLKAEVSMKLSPVSRPFSEYSQYLFRDPSIGYYDPDETVVYEGKLDAGGIAKIRQEFPESTNSPGIMKAVFYTRVFEKGGDFSMDVFSKKISPYPEYIGILPPKDEGYGVYDTGKNYRFEIITLDKNGKPVPVNNLKLSIYKLEWNWWWNASEDNIVHFATTFFNDPVREETLRTDAGGKTHFTLKIPEEKSGRYFIRIYDSEGGHATGKVAYFLNDYWRSPEGSDGQKPTMLMISKDRDRYRPGEQIHLTFPSPEEGNALVSIENGSEVLSQQWVKTSAKETRISIPATAEMAPNAFIHITLLQPHANTANDMPLRLYGIVPVTVENKDSRLHPVIQMPGELAPEQTYQIRVSEQKGKPMTYTLAVVDEGLLDLTRFRTPDLYEEFNRKQALGVLTWDMFDEVIGAYGGRLDKVFAIGGDEEVHIEKGKKPNLFKPVVSFLGPFRLGAGKSRTHRIKMPNYIGSVRVMVVAGNRKTESYGSAEKTVPVRKPLMVLAGGPVRLSPGESFEMPVTVFAMDPEVKKVKISVTNSKNLNITGDKLKNLTFDTTGDRLEFFKIKAGGETGVAYLDVSAVSGKYTAKYRLNLEVSNPNPVTTKIIEREVQPHSEVDITADAFGVPGTNRLMLEAGTLPPLDFSRHLEYLIRYPHGCVEQTVSSVFPQLYLDELFDLSAGKAARTRENIRKGIKRLSLFQTFDGGMAYWIGGSVSDDWGTSYAGHFLFEAAKKGYALPVGFKSRWIKYQRGQARSWRHSAYRNDARLQAYRLYTLALAGSPEWAAMNRLREMPGLDNAAKWVLASAYALGGQSGVAGKLIRSAHTDFKNPTDYYTYGSPLRNKAMALEAMVLTGDSGAMTLAREIAGKLSSGEVYNTQTTSYALMALSKMLVKNGGSSLEFEYMCNGEGEHIKTSKSVVLRSLSVSPGKNDIRINNPTGKHLNVRILAEGKLPVGQEQPDSRNLVVQVRYTGSDGIDIPPGRLVQGTDITAMVKVINNSDDYISHIALTQIFPAGWEILNTSFTGYAGGSSGAEYTDTRDDRVYHYFDLGAGKSKDFEVHLNAAYPGTYYLFGVQAEAMYRPDYFARSKGRWVKVIRGQ